jgi:hypothetical protein
MSSYCDAAIRQSKKNEKNAIALYQEVFVDKLDPTADMNYEWIFSLCQMDT